MSKSGDVFLLLVWRPNANRKKKKKKNRRTRELDVAHRIISRLSKRFGQILLSVYPAAASVAMIRSFLLLMAA